MIHKNFVTLFAVFVFIFLLFPVIGFAATPSITTNETVANVAAGTNDQAAGTVTTTANVAEVKASRTLTVGALPGSTETITTGTCVVTFTTVASSTSDELNCGDNVASIDRTLSTTDTQRTVAEIAAVLRTLTSVSDTGHGALTVTGTTTTAVFTTTGTEASATVITFTDSTTGDITSTASTTGVIPVAQVNTVTIAGTVDTGDVHTATLPTVGAVTYTVTSSDTTTANIATGLNAAILASAGYAGQAFTSATSTNTVILTAKVAGTGFTQTSGAANRSAVAQVVTFTPANLDSGWTLTITINGTDYSYTQLSSDTAQTVVEALQSLVTADVAVGCTEDNVTITCTAATAGTAFTYSTSVTAPASNSSSSSGPRYRCQDKNASNYASTGRHQQSLCTYSTTPTPTQMSQEILTDLMTKLRELITQAQALGVPVSPAVLSLLNQAPVKVSDMPIRNLEVGMNGEDVRMLQRLLNNQGFKVAATGAGSLGSETTQFGALTQAALATYQSANSIAPASGYFGPVTRAQMKSVKIEGLWW